jgi:hypothetical protein
MKNSEKDKFDKGIIDKIITEWKEKEGTGELDFVKEFLEAYTTGKIITTSALSIDSVRTITFQNQPTYIFMVLKSAVGQEVIPIILDKKSFEFFNPDKVRE